MTVPHRALVIIDPQLEYFEGALPIRYPDREESLTNILRAVETAEQNGIPVVLVQHLNPVGAAAFAKGSREQGLHPQIAHRRQTNWLHIEKRYASAFDGTELAKWLTERQIDTITLAGYMSNNCILATAAGAAPHGLTAEVLSDASGAIALTNSVGAVTAKALHETLMVLLHSNFAAVTTTASWANAVAEGKPSERSNLVASASGSSHNTSV